MKFRWKLLIFLLLISMIPIISLRTFGIYNVREMAKNIIFHVRQKQVDVARYELQLVMNNYEKIIRATREQLEMALFYQIFEAKNKLTAESAHLEKAGPFFKTIPCTAADEVNVHELDNIFAPAGNSGRLVLGCPGQCIYIPSELKPGLIQADLVHLKMMLPMYAASSQYLGNLVVRQYLGLENGLISIYPCPKEKTSPTFCKQNWYQGAFEAKAMVWSRPFEDPISGQEVMAVSCPVTKEDESVVGVASIWISLNSLMDYAFLVSGLPSDTIPILCTLAMNPSNDNAGAKILASGGNFKSLQNSQQNLLWLTSSDEDEFKAFLKDIARQQYNIREMPFQGKMSFWSYGPLLRQGSAFVFIVNRDQLVAFKSDPLLHTIYNCLTKVENFTAGFLIFLLFLVVTVGIAFSRTITKPLTKLTIAAQRLSGGDFEARVPVFSGFEFGNLARIFNSVGPQLKDHYCMRRALEIAEEIEHNLLPEASPELPGLDIYGMTLFSDETGGDYFDYLCVDDEKKEKFCVAVGDVTDHGIAAAILMTTVRGLLRLRATIPGTLGDIVSDVNREFVKDVKNSGRFMTMFLARIDRHKELMEWVRAGHDPAILYDSQKDCFHSLNGGNGLPLGVSKEATYESMAFNLAPGQIIFLGTDGIWEASNSKGELFGKKRLHQVIHNCAGDSARDIALSILDAVEEFRGKEEQEDDLTLVIVKITAR
ncbi:MAG: SpoIIE family protein phosphatase [Desulfobacterales bacterium]